MSLIFWVSGIGFMCSVWGIVSSIHKNEPGWCALMFLCAVINGWGVLMS